MTHILLPKSGIHLDTENLPALNFFRNDTDELLVVISRLNQKEQTLKGEDPDVLWEALYPGQPKFAAPKRSSNWMSGLVGNHKQLTQNE